MMFRSFLLACLVFSFSNSLYADQVRNARVCAPELSQCTCEKVIYPACSGWNPPADGICRTTHEIVRWVCQKGNSQIDMELCNTVGDVQCR